MVIEAVAEVFVEKIVTAAISDGNCTACGLEAVSSMTPKAAERTVGTAVRMAARSRFRAVFMVYGSFVVCLLWLAVGADRALPVLALHGRHAPVLFLYLNGACGFVGHQRKHLVRPRHRKRLNDSARGS